MTKQLTTLTTVLLIILTIGMFSLSACQQTAPKTDTTSTSETQQIQDTTSDVQPTETKKVTFNITGENYKFIMDGQENPDIKVKAGTMVRVDFQSTEGFHDWVLDEFSAATKQVQAPDSTYVEFLADQPGEYEYYCSVGQHREQGMYGKFIVE